MNHERPGQLLERVILITALALLLFVTPVIYWWAQDDSPWFLVYLLWFIMIVLSAWLYFTQRDDDF